MRRDRLRQAATLFAIAAIGLIGAAPRNTGRFSRVDDARIANAASEPHNWLVHGGNREVWRYSALDQINVDTVKDLKPAWVMEFDTNRGQEATPIVVDGVAYVSTAWSKVYALDAKTGKQLWYYDPKVSGWSGAMTCCDVVNRGVAVYRDKVYLGALDGRLIALDARTGKVRWSTQTTEPNGVYTITSVPAVGDGLIFIGNAGGEFGGRGYVGAYDAETGKHVWRFYLTPGKPGVKDNAASDEIMDSLVQPTWHGPHNDYRGGANVWGSLVYDPELKQLYMGTGNGFPWNRWHRSEGKGDNLFIASVVALNAATGRYKWHYQETPGDTWDFDADSDIVLLDLPVKGQTRKALIHTPKAGYAWELDRETGRVISAKPFIPGVTWTTGPDPVTGKMIPVDAAYYDNKNPVRASGFGHNWHPISYSPKTGLLYLAASQGPPGLFNPKPEISYTKGIDERGIYVRGQTIPEEVRAKQPPVPSDSVERGAYLLAWDVVKQAPAWKAPGSGGGTLATGGNLVFYAKSRGVMGALEAYRADNGQKMWSYDTPNAILTGPVSYMVDGEQYILVPTGASLFPPVANDLRERQPGRLVAFKLGGKARLPPEPPPARPIAVVPADQQWSAADLAWAKETFAQTCARCHGERSINNNVAPDLRRSPFLASKTGWKSVVEDGAMEKTGMISWSWFLPPGGSEKLRGYVVEEARKALAAPAGAPPPRPTDSVFEHAP
jgi:quinohemoprotein ethanol dehydrogenase